jgi:hypothetical protein
MKWVVLAVAVAVVTGLVALSIVTDPSPSHRRGGMSCAPPSTERTAETIWSCIPWAASP